MNRMNLILIVCIFACLPNTNQGFVTSYTKVVLKHRGTYSLDCLSLGGDIGRLEDENVLSTLIAFKNILKGKRNSKNVIQSIRNAIRFGMRKIKSNKSSSGVESSLGCTKDIPIDIINGNSNGNGNSKIVQSMSMSQSVSTETSSLNRIEGINRDMKNMRAKVLAEKVRLLPSFIIVNILSFLKFVRPCVASGKSRSSSIANHQ